MSSDPKGTDNLQAEIAREYKEFKSSGEVMRLDDEPDELTTLVRQLAEREKTEQDLWEKLNCQDNEIDDLKRQLAEAQEKLKKFRSTVTKESAFLLMLHGEFEYTHPKETERMRLSICRIIDARDATTGE